MALKFTYLAFGSVFGGTRAALALLPEVPSLYAFFRSVVLSPNSDSDQFSKAVLDHLESALAPEHTAKFGPLHTGRLASRPMLPPSLAQRLRSFCDTLEAREFVAALIQHATPLQAPLYVGKTNDLRRRIAEHMEPMSNLSVRLRESGLSLEKTLLSYCIFDELTEDNEIRLLEEVLTYYCRPGFVLRPG